MAVQGAYCGWRTVGRGGGFDRRHCGGRPNSRLLCSLAVSNGACGGSIISPSVKIGGRRVERASEAAWKAREVVFAPPEEIGGGRGERRSDAVVLDEWMRDSVEEIVRNLHEAPLVVNVYSDGDKTTTFRTERAEEEGVWRRISERWQTGVTPVPEGVIFVERLSAEDDGVTRAWGVVVQCRGGGEATCGPPACYLLKTCWVGPGESGIALRCTHFCLAKVKSFTKSAKSQLEDVWLVQDR